MYGRLVAKVNKIDTSGFPLKAKYDTDKSELEKKISDNLELVKKTNYNAKISEIEGKIPRISSLATIFVLNSIKNKMMLVLYLKKKQIITQKLVKLKKSLLIIMMIDILLLQNLVI